MPNLASAIKEEVSRLARKEIRKQTAELRSRIVLTQVFEGHGPVHLGQLLIASFEEQEMVAIHGLRKT